MNIDDLTLGQIKQLQTLFGQQKGVEKQKQSKLVGKHVIVRTESSGVWFGEVAEHDSQEVTLKNARMLYEWWAAKGLALSGVAVYGLQTGKSNRILARQDFVHITDSITFLFVTDVAKKSIEEAPDAEAK